MLNSEEVKKVRQVYDETARLLDDLCTELVIASQEESKYIEELDAEQVEAANEILKRVRDLQDFMNGGSPYISWLSSRTHLVGEEKPSD